MSDFPVLDEVHFCTDLESADDFTKKHTPAITVAREGEAVTVTVETGHYVAHPNEAGHFFNWIELYVGDSLVAHFEGAAGVVRPVFTTQLLHVEPGTTISAFASCNLHGIWKATSVIPA